MPENDLNVWTNVEDPLDHEKVSITELRTLLRCTKKHDYAYRQGLESKDPPSYLGKGRYLHMLMEAFLQSHVENENVTDVDVLSQRVLQELSDMRLEGDATATVGEPDRQQVNGIVQDYLNQVDMDGIEIEAIEQELYVDLSWRNVLDEPVLLHGFIDAVVRAGDDVWLMEHKTAGRAWSQGQFAFDYQGRLYSAAYAELFGERPMGIQFNFFYPKRHDVKQVYVTQEESDLLVAEIQSAVNLRDSQQIVRMPHWGCNDCWFKDLCHAELIGSDAGYIRETQYVVNQDKADRFQEVT